RLLQEYQSIDGLLENVQKIGGLTGLRGAASVQQKIESAQELLRLSRQLVCLDCKVEPFCSVNSVATYHWNGPVADSLQPLFEELEFESLFGLFGAPAAQGDGRSSDRYADKKFEIVTAASLQEVVRELRLQQAFAFDTETTSLAVLDCTLVGISLSWNDSFGYYFPLAGTLDAERRLDSAEVYELLAPIFADPAVKKYGANLKYDIEVLNAHGYRVEGAAFDAMLCAYVLDPDKRDFGLKSLTKTHLGEVMMEFAEVVGDCEHIGAVDLDKTACYACHDAEASWRLFEKLDPLLGERDANGAGSPRAVFEDIEMPLVPVLAAMELAGIRVDIDLLGSLGEEFSGDLVRLEQQIHELAGEEFNLNSPKQLSLILFEKLGIPTRGIKKTQSGYSTNAAMLERIRDSHEIVERILEYREIHKLSSTYVEALQRLVHPRTGRIHASFNQAVAATGRLSSSDPNLQNIPIRTPRGRRLREAFIAEEGSVLISADYSQIELRILAHMSGDPGLTEAFRSGEDIHERTAREIFGPSALAGADMKELRRIAKTINFGLIYGMGSFRLAGELGVSRGQAQEYIDSYFARYPGVLGYFNGLKEEAEKRGYVSTLFGRRRYLETLDTEGRDAGYAGRSMMNAPIQGTAAEIIKLAMIRLHRRLQTVAGAAGAGAAGAGAAGAGAAGGFGFSDAPCLALPNGSARIVLQVHDELVVEAKADVAQVVRDAVVDEMEQAVALSVPLKVDVRVGHSWGGAAA
ncbi:MAG: hypothetical protein KDD69_13530, partial [Bdellovibrionales bacterium]|nr:hypothetical protein [Bdellovibrionales bacterium]